MANFDDFKIEIDGQKKKAFPESILTGTFCKKRGLKWSNLACVAPFTVFRRLYGVPTTRVISARVLANQSVRACELGYLLLLGVSGTMVRWYKRIDIMWLYRRHYSIMMVVLIDS